MAFEDFVSAEQQGRENAGFAGSSVLGLCSREDLNSQGDCFAAYTVACLE